MKIVLIAFLLLVINTVLHAEPKEPVYVKEGFLTGNSFRALSYDGKRGYAIGFLEGIFISPMFDAPKSGLQWVEGCTVGMADAQVVAIMEKFLVENPARWHQQMNVLAWAALKEGCGK